MSIPIYRGLPPIERKADGSRYYMTPSQRKRANHLIGQNCCSYDGNSCLEQDNGEAQPCTQRISNLVCCKWFRFAVLPLDEALEAEIFRMRDAKRCTVCGKNFVSKSNRGKYCASCAAIVHRRQKTESERKRRLSVDN